MPRDKMIRLLVINALEDFGSLWGHLWLEKILEFGFRGYSNMTDMELVAEVKARGLDRVHTTEDEPDDLPSADDDADIAKLLACARENPLTES